MPNTLVINLTRFGDLLQTQPLLTHLKQKGHLTGLVCLENFAPAAGLLRDLDRVYPLPGALFLRETDRSWVRAVSAFREWVNALQDDMHWDGLANLTSSLSAKILARSLSMEDKHGFSVDEFGFGRFSNKWSIFLEASAGFRGSSPFNVADIFLRTAGAKTDADFDLKPPPQEARDRMGRILSDKAPSGCRGYVGFQLGASAQERRWPTANFAELGGLLWEGLGLCPVLLGSDSEKGLARQYREKTPTPCINMLGETGLTDLAAVLTHTLLLVTNDTGTMHLAAGLKIPVIAFFLATAQPWDTAPYREGVLCLEPNIECHPCGFSKSCANNFACREVIPAGRIFETIKTYLEQGNWPDYPGSEARAWVTARRYGYMDLENRSAGREDDRSKWMRIQKRAYSAFLEDKTPDSTGLDRPSREFSQLLTQEARELGSLFELVRTRGEMLVRSPRQAVHKKFMADWFRVGRTLEQSKIFPTLALLWKVHSQDAGRDMNEFLEVCKSYERLLFFFGTEFE
jgi:ADP-heptose:LPS heptosyltransferase